MILIHPKNVMKPFKSKQLDLAGIERVSAEYAKLKMCPENK